jgi:transposase InsO family protein
MATPALVVANVLRRQFVATRPNQKWVSDITYVPTRQGWLYVAVLMDLYSRRIVGWAMDDQMTTTLTLKALEMALQQRPVQVGLLHHSDRGSQYGAMAYQQRLATRGIRC